MLYDPKWKSPPVMPKTADEVLQGLVAWLEGQPGDVEYVWFEPSDCLFCRYSRSIGGETYLNLYRVAGEGTGHSGPLTRIEIKVAHPRPWTYAAALERARALL